MTASVNDTKISKLNEEDFSVWEQFSQKFIKLFQNQIAKQAVISRYSRFHSLMHIVDPESFSYDKLKFFKFF